MSLGNAQLEVVFKGVRSICDELLSLIEEAPPVPGAMPLVTTVAPPMAAVAPPVAAPAVTAPPAAAPAAPLTGASLIDIDTEGIPWDERIHTAKKSKLKSGVWRLKPGVDALLVAQVKSELTLAARGTTDPEEQHPGTPMPSTIPGAVAPSIAQDVSAEPMSWSDLLNKIVGAGKTPEEVLAACAACGVDNIGKLQDVPLLIPNVAVALGL